MQIGSNVSVFLIQGCHVAVEALLKKNIQWVIVAALVIAFLQVCHIDKQKHVLLKNIIWADKFYCRQFKKKKKISEMLMSMSSPCVWFLILPDNGHCVCLLVDERHTQRLRSHVIQLHTWVGAGCSGHAYLELRLESYNSHIMHRTIYFPLVLILDYIFIG